ncbi:hypothetical protein PPTG_00542 [Phytophthora nicotianae INRA-310]|uniref:Necrosis inducing-like protein NPP1 type n=1 Tax=Phytophthora nicotianae (strain INRA-310) TaxID=761204 RepID=W2RFC8_PHYN3|nr:hypothetical protein PPTG_00542 [Phytophthora nicotianae INRA-310]ETN24092.1 hypothetical protein PPTG_00542 [Phytophthora nicotianae INRA-310]
MNFRRFIITITVALLSVEAISINHDKAEPIPQPEPVTVSEKAAVKFKPELTIGKGTCASFPAVNTAGETSGGLKGSGGTGGCKVSLLGSQVYGRAQWYNDVWAIMYAWYFPKGFWDASPFWRHDWANAVVWVDNPAAENPKVLGISLSKSSDRYNKEVPARLANGNTPVVTYYNRGLNTAALMSSSTSSGESPLDLIMWEQLTDVARASLNDKENFGRSDVPFSDENFPGRLEKAWPF